MLKVTTLIASLLAAPLAFSVSAQPLTDVEYISVSAVSATPSMLEDAIARLAVNRRRHGKLRQCVLIIRVTPLRYYINKESLRWINIFVC